MHVLRDGCGIQSGLFRFAEVTEPAEWTLPGRGRYWSWKARRESRSTTDQYWS
jgi:hypothetical protein